MKLSEMKSILASRQIALTKSLGQNFLHDRNQLERIVGAAELTAQDKVLEIGPGLGPLTQLLLQQTAEVIAVEKDRRLYDFLKQTFAGNPKLNLIHDDALDYLEVARNWSDWKVVSNLPYSVGSPILVQIAQTPQAPERVVATLQLEVAQRLTATAHQAAYGLLTVLVGLTYTVQRWFKIPASCFFPVPDVDSACVVLLRRNDPLLKAGRQETFTKLVKRSFSQRRKMMFKLLKADWPMAALQRAFAEVQLSPEVRAEHVAVEQFAKLAQILDSASDNP
jgi:16S rRNA (adenine1518-N6/adenine1519-N6)-dimethyltransferase